MRYLLVTVLCLLTNLSFADSVEKNTLADFDKGHANVINATSADNNKAHYTPSQIKAKGLTPIMLCDVAGKCNKYDKAQLRGAYISPVVACEASDNCQGLTPPDIEDRGLIPGIMCDHKGKCGKEDYRHFRKQGLEPMIVCGTLKECLNRPLENKVEYVVICNSLTSCP